jgi:rSAM/selenodomain-associated transferase 1
VSRRLLALFAKLPRPGEVKTRLAPSVGEEGAARLYEAMLLDILAQHAEAGCDLALWFTPAEGRPWFEKHAPERYRLHEQQGPDLASRMGALFRAHTTERYDHVVLRGTDSPTLPVARIDEAFDALERSDVVVCPDLDGGYNLIGLCAARDEMFNISMSTGSVLDETLARADAAGLRVTLLPAHHDVDTGDDLALLAAGISGVEAPRTRAWLRENWRS